MRPTSPCPVCASRYTLYVQDARGRRTGAAIAQFVCLDCRSFFNPSHYQETDQQQQDDFEFLRSFSDAHYANQSQLCLELITRAPHVRTVCEIGYGLGWFLRACNDYGRKPYGFEVNPHCHAFAAGHLALDCALGRFDACHEARYDLFVAIMVFEHLEAPRDLFALMRDRLNPDGLIYICVPFVERRDWPYLWTASTNPAAAPPDVFYDNDVHITHFSIEGLCRMGLSLGARSAEHFVSQDVAYKSPGSYGGVLFRF